MTRGCSVQCSIGPGRGRPRARSHMSPVFDISASVPNYDRVMTALDFAGSARGERGGAPSFFTGNIASLSEVLSDLVEMRVTEGERGLATVQTVVYQMAR